MLLTFWADETSFDENISGLRYADLQRKPYAPTFLNILIDGLAVEASTCHIRADGWFAYSDDAGEQRVELDRVLWVKAFFKGN